MGHTKFNVLTVFKLVMAIIMSDSVVLDQQTCQLSLHIAITHLSCQTRSAAAHYFGKQQDIFPSPPPPQHPPVNFSISYTDNIQ